MMYSLQVSSIHRQRNKRLVYDRYFLVLSSGWCIFLHDIFQFFIFWSLYMFIFTWSNNLTAKQGDNYNVRSIKLKGSVTTMSSISKSKHFAAGTEKGIVSNLLSVQKHTLLLFLCLLILFNQYHMQSRSWVQK